MSKVSRRQAITAGIVGGAVVLAGASPVQAAKHPKASKVLDAMEGFRKEIPPPQGLAEGEGRSIKGLGDYTTSHLSGVAGRLGVGTRTECLMLLTYLKDADLKLRLIALEAINKATNAYPNGWSSECVTDTGSEGHRKMLFRFLEVIDKLPA